MKCFQYTLWDMTRRLFRKAIPIKKELIISTLASLVGNLAQMGLVGFGALLLLGQSVVLAIIGMVSSALAIVICRYLEGVISHAGAYRLLSSMRVDLFSKIDALAPSRLLDREKGDILNIAVSDIETVEFFFAHTIGPMLTVILLPCLTLGIAFCYDPLFALCLVPIYLFVGVLFPLLAIRAGRQIGMTYRERLGKLKSLVLESVYGLKDIQIFGYGQKRMAIIDEKTQQINQAAHGLTLHRQIVQAAPTFFVYLARILIMLVASYLVSQGKSPLQGTVVLSLIVMASLSSTQSLTTVVSSLLETYGAAERLFLIEDAEPAVKEDPLAKDCGPVESIRFEDVSFQYASDRAKVLDHFSLQITQGERLGIMGESGMGKSTILHLLLHFYEPDQGCILINGLPLSKISMNSLRQRLILVSQETFLCNDTIAHNIALGKPEATLKKIQIAAQKAGIHDWIMTLEKGYETSLGEMASRLSGGERQRLGIARALLMEPDVLIMDEPTSSLDVFHEMELLGTLDQLGEKMTVIIVSHRPSTLTHCDRIVQLKDGKQQKSSKKQVSLL